MPGPTMVAIFSLGVHPTGMKKAVMRPQAMIAPMLGITMFDKKVPNFWTCTRAEVRGAGVCVAVAMPVPFSDVSPGARPVAGLHVPDVAAVMHVMFICERLYIAPPNGASRIKRK